MIIIHLIILYGFLNKLTDVINYVVIKLTTMDSAREKAGKYTIF
jgi:hypothetical protein